MAQVIVPKNYIYNHDTVNAGKSISTLFTSPLALQYSGTFMYDHGALCNDITINYSLGTSTSSANGGSQVITIQNDSNLVGRCLIVDITNLPKFKNTSASSTRTVTLVFKHNSTYIQLKSLSIATSATYDNTYGSTNSLNGKYYVNLLTNTATQNANESECCKAVVPKNWIYPASVNNNLEYNVFTYDVSLSSTMVSNISIPKYLGCGVNITWGKVPTNDLEQSYISKAPEIADVTITLNISETSCRFVKLILSNFPTMKNSSISQQTCNIRVMFPSNTFVIINTTTVVAGSYSSPSSTILGWADGIYWLDLKTQTLIDSTKAIATF